MTKRALAFARRRLHNLTQNTTAMAASDIYYSLLSDAARNPSLYKLCLVCGNIVYRDQEECTYCGAYRFDSDAEHVSNSALDQATSARAAITSPGEFADD